MLRAANLQGHSLLCQFGDMVAQKQSFMISRTQSFYWGSCSTRLGSCVSRRGGGENGIFLEPTGSTRQFPLKKPPNPYYKDPTENKETD
jgi:hypothetical protein